MVALKALTYACLIHCIFVQHASWAQGGAATHAHACRSAASCAAALPTQGSVTRDMASNMASKAELRGRSGRRTLAAVASQQAAAVPSRGWSGPLCRLPGPPGCGGPTCRARKAHQLACRRPTLPLPKLTPSSGTRWCAAASTWTPFWILPRPRPAAAGRNPRLGTRGLRRRLGMGRRSGGRVVSSRCSRRGLPKG